MKYRKLNISLPEDLVINMDQAAELEYTTRSDFIRLAVLDRLRRLQSAVDMQTEAASDEQIEQAFVKLRQERARRANQKYLKALRSKQAGATLYSQDENC